LVEIVGIKELGVCRRTRREQPRESGRWSGCYGKKGKPRGGSEKKRTALSEGHGGGGGKRGETDKKVRERKQFIGGGGVTLMDNIRIWLFGWKGLNGIEKGETILPGRRKTKQHSSASGLQKLKGKVLRTKKEGVSSKKKRHRRLARMKVTTKGQKKGGGANGSKITDSGAVPNLGKAKNSDDSDDPTLPSGA